MGTVGRIAGLAILCLTYCSTATQAARPPEANDRYEAIIFQEGGAIGLADMNPRVLPIRMSTRSDTGKIALYIETDQAGLARVHDDAQLPLKGPILIYKTLGPHVQATEAVKANAGSLSQGRRGALLTYYLFALLEPAEGHEETFNDYYDSTHLPEVITVPGMQWGVRGRLVSQQPEEFKGPRYSAIYEFKSYDLKKTMAEIDRRLKDGTTKAFPNGSVGRNALVFYAGPAESPRR